MQSTSSRADYEFPRGCATQNTQQRGERLGFTGARFWDLGAQGQSPCLNVHQQQRDAPGGVDAVMQLHGVSQSGRFVHGKTLRIAYMLIDRAAQRARGRHAGNRIRYSLTSASSFNVAACVALKAAKSVREFMICERSER